MTDLTTLLINDIISCPSKAEPILETLTSDQIQKIESTLHRVKRRKIDKDNQVSAIAHALATIVSAAMQPHQQQDPVAEMKDGIEWVSFMYSHNRTLQRYSIKTDIGKVAIEKIPEQFKTENCVYPRANLAQENYKGNRWAYETECNDLGWKLAWLNKDIAGKRGLIQRAVDSYRNRYPSMRSRRVARQEKLMNGTLRKRKNKEWVALPDTLEAAIVKPSHQPKTMAIDDLDHNRYRIKIGIESLSLDEIPLVFRQQNCPFPRATAYLNPRILAGKKNLLQRALDAYRIKFMPSLQPRTRLNTAATTTTTTTPTPTFSLDEAKTTELETTADPMISPPSYMFDESCNTSSSSSLACTPSPPFAADIFPDVYDAFTLPPINDTFLLLDNNTNLGIRCDSFSQLDPLF